MSRALQAEALVHSYLNSLTLLSTPEPLSGAAVEEPSLPAIYSPVAAFRINNEPHVLFMTGEYDYDDARLLAVIARYKTLVLPVCRTVFLTVGRPGETVRWLGEPNLGAALVAATHHDFQGNALDPASQARNLARSLDRLFGVKLVRMGEGLAQLDQILAKELLPIWTLSGVGRELIRPLARALNYFLRRALDAVLPRGEEFQAEPLLRERIRVWKKNELWYRFQSLEYIEDIFNRRQPGLAAAYQGLYQLNQNPEASVDRVRLRVLSAAVDPAQPDKVPFGPGAGVGGSSLRGEFGFARRTLVEQHGAGVPDLVWAVAECPACKSRSRFRREADSFSLFQVSQAMDRIKQMLVGEKKPATFYCPRCRQPLGFEHLVLAAYAHYMADLEQDVHLLNERRPGRRRTYIQVLCEAESKCRASAVTDSCLARLAGRSFSAMSAWQELLEQTGPSPKWRELGPGFVGLVLPPLDPMKVNTYVARFHDQLVAKRTGFWPVLLDEEKAARCARPGDLIFPRWLGRFADKAGPEQGYRLAAFVDMDRIEDLFMKSAKKLNLLPTRALDGSLEVRGPNLTLPIDLRRPVEEAVLKGHYPGVLAVREAGRQAKRLQAGELTLTAIRDYLGKSYTVRYNPTTAELTVDPPSGLPASFPFDQLIEEWARDTAKTRKMIIGKVG